MLCGISVRFQTLFHLQRQVAHALLTRPPLSSLNASRRINSNNSVRLECVMHAASVHPEPGSNSRKNFILHASWHLTSSRAIYLSFTFCLSSILNKLWRDQYLHLQCFVLLSCCSIFNDRFSPPAFLRTARLLYHTTFPLSIPFFIFFQKYFSRALRVVSLSFLGRACPLYYFYFYLSRVFSTFLLVFKK